MNRISVFTPTYNRGYIIEKLYYSLKKQTFRNFEWIVVDDGSTDDTERLFEKFKQDNNDFDIIYFKQNNGGKHRAINKGLTLAKGELFYIVDSDDYLPDNALEIIDRVEKTIPSDMKSQFAGICGNRGYSEHNVIGKSFDGEFLDITMLERTKYNITGDKAEAFYTNLIKKYPFPEFEGEKFLTECVVWDKIAFDGFVLRFYNETVMITNYLPDGLTAHEDELFKNTPKGFGLYLYQSGIFGRISGITKWNKYLHYYYTFRDKLSFKEIAQNLHYSFIKLWLRLFFLRLFYRFYDC